MGQMTIYLPRELEQLVRDTAEGRGTSVSALLAELVVRELQPSQWPAEFLDTWGACGGDLEIPRDSPPEPVEPL